MKKLAFFFVAVLTLCTCNAQKLNYPATKKVHIADEYFGIIVEDPYRWFEVYNSPESGEWVEEQNKLTHDYLEKLPYRDKIKSRLTKLWNYAWYSTPQQVAGKYIFSKNNEGHNQSVWYIADSLNGKTRVLLSDSNRTLSDLILSDDGRYLVYRPESPSGEGKEIYVKNIETGNLLPDRVWSVFSGPVCYKDGFYYNSFPDISEATKVYFHRIGTSQDEDRLVSEGNRDHPLKIITVDITNDKRFLIFYYTGTGSGNALSVIDLTSTDQKVIPIKTSLNDNFHVIDNVGDDIYILSNIAAPENQLVRVNINHPQSKDWTIVIPEKKENKLVYTTLIGNKILANYQKAAHSVLELYSYDGSFISEVELPTMGTVTEISGRKDQPLAFYSFTSYNTPSEILVYNDSTRTSVPYLKPAVKFNIDDYVVKQEFCTSKGTRVPMFIVHKKGLQLTGKNPTLMHGYGGFSISQTPEFSPALIALLENDFVFVDVNTRGGGEYGPKWHEAGIKMHKQNAFDDFIAAAEYLISKKYTSKEKLACTGGSNGGLLVAAVINQRPDLFKVALPNAALMDMLRYHEFKTKGSRARGFIYQRGLDDYGTSEDSKAMFECLYSYSPYHTIKKGVKYPAILASTALDDEVVPSEHTYKYIARMQEYNGGNLPTLIRIEDTGGHNEEGRSASQLIDEYTDYWAFLFYHLGVKIK